MAGIAAWTLPLVLLAQGYAAFYGDGVMEQTWSYRSSYLPNCPQCVGMVALPEAEHIGRLVYIDWGWPEGIAGPYYVIDCAQAQHLAAMHQKQRVIEVSYTEARKHNMLVRGTKPVRVLWLPPEKPCPIPAGGRAMPMC
jgi:hypothetical protein